MRQIGIQAVEGYGPSSKLIAYRGGLYSHIDIILPDGDGKLSSKSRLLGARSDWTERGGVPPGVQIRSPFYESWKLCDRYILEVTREQHYLFYTTAMAQRFKPYDDYAILGFVFNRDWRQPDAWVCSELAIWLLEITLKFRVALKVNKIDPTMCAMLYDAKGAQQFCLGPSVGVFE